LIVSFVDQETEDIYHGACSKKARRRLPVTLWEKAQTKLDMLDKAKRLEDLRVPPNNRFEKLAGDLSGNHSIRINDQYRIVFVWEKESSSARDVKITDYH
jgi:toxin HigB-1